MPSGDGRSPKQNQGEKMENRPNPNSWEVQGRRKGKKSRGGNSDSPTLLPNEAETITAPETVEGGTNEPSRREELETEALHREDGTHGAQDPETPPDQRPPSMVTREQ